VQWRIVIVFKHQRIYGYRSSHPAYSPSSSPCCTVNSHPVSFLYSRGRAPSSPQQADECAKLFAPSLSLWLHGPNLPPSSSWRGRSCRGVYPLLSQCSVLPPPRQRRGLSGGDLAQRKQGELVQATILRNCNHRGYLRRLDAPLKNMFHNFMGGLSSGNGSGGGGDALPTAENRVTFDEFEATADFENQLGPPPEGLITQTQGDAPMVGYIPLPPPGVGGGMNPPPPPPQQAGMGGGSSPTGSWHTPASPPSSKNWEENVRPGVHPGRACHATKGNPWRPGKSDIFPRVRGQCPRIPGVFGHAG